jgi:hypothetical protein
MAGLPTLAPVSAAEGPEGVSPGADDRLLVVGERCPTFSWKEVPGAASYELVAYEIPVETTQGPEEWFDLSTAVQALYARVPGGASGWTPSLEQSLVAGTRYVWFVRAVFDQEPGDAVDTSEWSPARFFEVSAAPSVEEVAQAVDVLRAFLASERGIRDDLTGELLETVGSSTHPADMIPGSEPGTATKAAGARSVATAFAAVRGEGPDPASESYGLVGITASPGGAGIGAANTAGGPDLVLDGIENGEADTLVTQAGIDRPSPSAEVFGLVNSGGGSLNLDVDGAVQAQGAVSGASLQVTGGQVVDSSRNITAAAITASAVTAPGVTATSVLDASGAGSVSLPPSGISGAGAGSGLDADSVDGLDSSAFMAAGTDAWVDTAGDTMAGALDMAGNPIQNAGGISLQSGALTLDNGETISNTVDQVVRVSDGADVLDVDMTGSVALIATPASGDFWVQGAAGSGSTAGTSVRLVAGDGGATGGNGGDVVIQPGAGGEGGLPGVVNVLGDLSATSLSGDGSGLTNVPATDLSCVDCVTATEIAAGAVGTSEIADDSVAAIDIATGGVASSEILNGSIGSADINTSQVQRRVSGTCSTNYYMRAVSSTGSVTCQSDRFSGWVRYNHDFSCNNNNICWGWISCGSSRKVLGGGFELPGAASGDKWDVQLNESFPLSNYQWQATATNTSGVTLTFRVWAICAPSN